jgi:tRNA threonylcarbamoyladenosine biosynthesis protein TsaE
VTPLSFATASIAETHELGSSLARIVEPNTVLVLQGDLGSGKTALAQGIARGLGVTDRVTSPTFTMMASYETNGERGIKLFLHADLYRVSSGIEADDLAIAELVEDAAVAAVEWGDLAPDVLGVRRVAVSITMGAGDDDRHFSIEPGPLAPEDVVRELRRWALS